MLFIVMLFCCLVTTRAQVVGYSRQTTCSGYPPKCTEKVSHTGGGNPYLGGSYAPQTSYFNPGSGISVQSHPGEDSSYQTREYHYSSSSGSDPEERYRQQYFNSGAYPDQGSYHRQQFFSSGSSPDQGGSFRRVYSSDSPPDQGGSFQTVFSSDPYPDQGGSIRRQQIFGSDPSIPSTQHNRYPFSNQNHQILIEESQQTSHFATEKPRPIIHNPPTPEYLRPPTNPIENKQSPSIIYNPPTPEHLIPPSYSPPSNSSLNQQPKEETPSQKPEIPKRFANSTITCRESRTRINGGKTVCSGVLLFEDHFNTGKMNFSNWKREQYVASEPDMEFVTYESRAQNCYIKDRVLYLKVTTRDDPTVTKIDLSNGCTKEPCTVVSGEKNKILPPVVAAKIKSTFSFLYGKVEIRAQLPKGDWIYPQVNLDPLGPFSYEKGRLWVAYARGNQDLKRYETGEQIGNSVLYSGGVLGQKEPLRTHSTLSVAGEGGWGDAFHVYTMVWAPDGIQILVDGEEQGNINPPYTNAPDGAPFNKEFVMSLGIAAGGFSDFPEGSTSNGNPKPWKMLSVRPMANFYRSKDQWYPTWAGDNSALKIDYVKVWAL